MAQNMIVYSWNMLYRNRELDRAFDFISKSDFDVFCLQEVPDVFLRRLQALPCSVAFRKERELPLKDGPIPNYIVILSKHPISAQGDLPHADHADSLPLRTRLFTRLMPFELIVQTHGRRDMYADITVAGAPIRVFNLHLALAYPAWRMREFETAMLAHSPDRPTIICGDFNILEKPHITPLNWLLGGRMTDTLLYSRERTHIERRFVEHKLVNPLFGGITHPLSQSQLDHILVSHALSVKNTAVIPDRFGSDHHPIRVEIA